MAAPGGKAAPAIGREEFERRKCRPPHRTCRLRFKPRGGRLLLQECLRWSLDDGREAFEWVDVPTADGDAPDLELVTEA